MVNIESAEVAKLSPLDTRCALFLYRELFPISRLLEVLALFNHHSIERPGNPSGYASDKISKLLWKLDGFLMLFHL
jgi:hypothetical protein